MGLGGDAWPIASHAMLIAVLVLLAWRVLHSYARPGLLPEAERLGLSAAVALASAVLALERVWAIFSRFMRAHGVDVYGLHPAPEFLSFLVAGSLYAKGAVILVARLGPAAARRRIILEASVLLAFWGALVAVLR